MNVRTELRAAFVDQMNRTYFDSVVIADLVSAIRTPAEYSDDDVARFAQQFLDAWNRHPNYRKCARFGLVLHALRNDPANAAHLDRWNRHVSQLGYRDFADWHHQYAAHFAEWIDRHPVR